MTVDRAPIFAAARVLVRRFAGAGWNYSQADVGVLDAGIDAAIGQTAARAAPALEPARVPAPSGAEPHEWPNLPQAYRWLRTIGDLPRHLDQALELMGTVETPGAANSPTIMGWRDELKAAGIKIEGYSADSVPWCGLFIAIVMLRAQRPVVDGPLWALNWSLWGQDGGQPELGDLLTFKREGGGHVALYIAEDRNGYYHVLGGNQSDKVCITRIEKKRMHACRQPAYQTKPASVRPCVVSATGIISENER